MTRLTIGRHQLQKLSLKHEYSHEISAQETTAVKSETDKPS